MKRFLILGLALAALFQVTSCKKKWKYDESSAPKTNAIVENAFSEMANMSDQAVKGNLTIYGIGQPIVRVGKYESFTETEKANCNVILTLDTVGTQDTLTIDWGTSNCTCQDQKQRRGKLIISYNGSYYNQGTIINYTPVNYYVNDHKVEGVMTIENMGPNSLGQPYYKVDIDGVVTLSTGEIATYTSDRIRTFTNGYTTLLNYWDDEYDITGTATAQVVNGDGYTANVINALHVKVGCPYITKGTLEITPTGRTTRTIDYGTGACDGTFTIEINGHTYTVVI
ncbi:hypothetical protein [Fluviicola taffensis]|uniref:Uncharacterized protein n=1 Tax=Fluviicola taffensis (strain DSM 16823 / NCIMB 13979 / RW262) TaxID=755732 RepID=F2IK49_FLUTR|nr:hypothetical protein [Fluviicola taffensis]AEA42948.1 hypothetical protein Fluta_0947 [Fluviicola taffensis DSM 16823]